jgi:hypothetical protein
VCVVEIELSASRRDRNRVKGCVVKSPTYEWGIDSTPKPQPPPQPNLLAAAASSGVETLTRPSMRVSPLLLLASLSIASVARSELHTALVTNEPWLYRHALNL